MTLRVNNVGNIFLMGKRYNKKFLSFFFILLATSLSTWDFSSPTRDQTRTPCSGSTQS